VKRELIDYRRNRAKETIEDAKILVDKGRLFSAVNRIYYAMFYEVTALLLTENLSSSKHSGIRALFNEKFVKTGKVEIEMGRLFSRVYEFREESDYKDFAEFELAKVKELLESAERFIGEIEKIIEERIGR